ncbi:MAG: hypothetical protein ACOX52_17730 [Verrucomicrobiota bacterium]
MLPLAFGLVPAEHRESVTAFVKSRGMACSVYAAQFLMEALYQAGEEQYALDLMRSTDERSWWNMLAAGSTVAMEAWAMKYKPNSDWNHAWEERCLPTSSPGICGGSSRQNRDSAGSGSHRAHGGPGALRHSGTNPARRHRSALRAHGERAGDILDHTAR